MTLVAIIDCSACCNCDDHAYICNSCIFGCPHTWESQGPTEEVPF